MGHPVVAVMRHLKLSGSTKPRLATRANVVVCVDLHRDRGGEQIDDDEVRTLAAQLSALTEQLGLGDYEGFDRFSSEARLYFASPKPHLMAAAAMKLIATLTWHTKVKIRVSRE